MIPGFNLDIKHKGKTFHIQTEDSGPSNPVIMTHLFLFGTILGTRRLEYGEAAGRRDLADHVRELMRAELRAMHDALLGGEFDELAHRPQRKPGGDIPLARRTGNQGPVLGAAAPAPPSPRLAEAPTPLVAPPAEATDAAAADAAAAGFTDGHSTDVRETEVGDPAGGPLSGVRETMDGDELVDASEMVESLSDSGSGTDSVELLSGIEEMGELPSEPASGPPSGLPSEPPSDAPGLTPGDDGRALVAPRGPAAGQTSGPPRLPGSPTPVRTPRANVEFPTDLVAETRFDDVILAWLLEDVDEP